MANTNMQKSTFTPPLELQHFFDEKTRILDQKKSLVDQLHLTFETMIFKTIIILLPLLVIAILMTSFVSTVFQYAIPLAILLPIVLTWKRYREFFSINAELKTLKNEYRKLGHSYKEAFREYSTNAQCDTTYDGWGNIDAGWGNNGWLDSADRTP